jgi:hypothetical protein
MADHAAGDDIFVYTGGIAPQHVVNAIIDESVDKIDDDAFRDNPNLRSVVCHDRVLKVGRGAFGWCDSLQRVKMPGVKIIEKYAFYDCNSLTHVEFGDKLKTVGNDAFTRCTSLKRVKLPKVKTIGGCAFMDSGVQDAELGEDLETLGRAAFRDSKLRRIAIPLKDRMFQLNAHSRTYTQFHECPDLTTVDLVGGIHKTVSSLHLESWRNEMNEEIQRMNQILPSTDPDEKTDAVRQWIQSIKSRFDHYKAEHRVLLMDVATLLELALWKAKLDDFKVEDDKCSAEENTERKAKINVGEARARKEARITSGADIIINNVLPYLKME